jgi:hypothetical protein
MLTGNYSCQIRIKQYESPISWISQKDIVGEQCIDTRRLSRPPPIPSPYVHLCRLCTNRTGCQRCPPFKEELQGSVENPGYFIPDPTIFSSRIQDPDPNFFIPHLA